MDNPSFKEQLYLYLKRFKGGGGYTDFRKIPLQLRKELYFEELQLVMKESEDND